MALRALQLLRRHGDAALALVLCGLVVVQVALLDVSAVSRATTIAGVATLAVPLARRARWPLALIALLTLGGLVGTALPKRVLDVEAVGLIVVLAIYNAAAHTEGWRAVAAGACAVALGVGALLGDVDGVNVAGVIFFALLFAAPWLAGRVVRRRRLSEARLARERDEARESIADERARIARELHDVVAHAISVIVLQSRGARLLLDEDPEESRTALATIERTGQQAMAEMRRLVGLLREDGADAALAPQPSLSRLDALVGYVRGAGLPVELVVDGRPVDLPPGVDLSAYRIVQEALTNALKHAGPARARVTLRYGADELEIDIRDDGAGGGGGDGGGNGLVGMRERVALYGGDLSAGPRPEGGYAVRARLPFASAR